MTCFSCLQLGLAQGVLLEAVAERLWNRIGLIEAAVGAREFPVREGHAEGIPTFCSLQIKAEPPKTHHSIVEETPFENPTPLLGSFLAEQVNIKTWHFNGLPHR